MERPIRRRESCSTRSRTGSSRRSDESYKTASTTHTSVYESPRSSPQYATPSSQKKPLITYDEYEPPALSLGPSDSTCSRLTYASTVPSIREELYDEPEHIEYIEPFYLPTYNIYPSPTTDLRPSDPRTYASFFPPPSPSHRLHIQHDDKADDGNMNLRIETEVLDGRHKVQLQLFHLRMQDLGKRQFSLRRYCRDSGREVCHSVRRYEIPEHERRSSKILSRSMSSALASLSLRNKDSPKRSSGSGSSLHSHRSPHRQDSGYGGSQDDLDNHIEFDNDEDDDVSSFMSSPCHTEKMKSLPVPKPTNSIKLEFSNYAQVDLRSPRPGKSSSHRQKYEFEYWGAHYVWKQSVARDHASATNAVSYHCVRSTKKGGKGTVVAHIVPVPCSAAQAREEEAAGAWVPRCEMWFTDKFLVGGLASDVAEVAVATGLVALVDGCVEDMVEHSHAERPKHIGQAAMSGASRSGKWKLEVVGPRELFGGVNERKGKRKEKRRHKSRREGSPLRMAARAF